MNKMAKSEVFSWRINPALKAQLEAVAREDQTTVSALLERITRDWLNERAPGDDEAAQQRMRNAAVAAAGKYKGRATTATNTRVRQIMGQQLMKKWRASQRRAPRRSD